MNYNNLSMEDLQEVCRNYGYDTAGKSKDELIAMLGGGVEDEVKEPKVEVKIKTESEIPTTPKVEIKNSDELITKSRELYEENKKLRKEIEHIRIEFKNLEDWARKHNHKIFNIKKLETENNQLKEKIKELETSTVSNAVYDELKNEIEKLRSENQELRKQLEQKELNSPNNPDYDIRNIAAKKKELADLVKELETEKKGLQDKLGNIDNRLAEVRKEQNELQELIKQLVEADNNNDDDLPPTGTDDNTGNKSNTSDTSENAATTKGERVSSPASSVKAKKRTTSNKKKCDPVKEFIKICNMIKQASSLPILRTVLVHDNELRYTNLDTDIEMPYETDISGVIDFNVLKQKKDIDKRFITDVFDDFPLKKEKGDLICSFTINEVSKNHVKVINPDEPRKILHSICVELEDKTIVTTDAKRLLIQNNAITDVEIKEGCEIKQVLIPVEVVKILVKQKDAIKAKVYGNNVVEFDFSNGIKVTSRLIDGTYPNYKLVVPNNPDTVTISRDYILSEIENSKVIAINEGMSKNELRSINVDIKIKDNIWGRFNVVFLGKIIENWSSEIEFTVKLSEVIEKEDKKYLTDAVSLKNDNELYIIAPVRWA